LFPANCNANTTELCDSDNLQSGYSALGKHVDDIKIFMAVAPELTECLQMQQKKLDKFTYEAQQTALCRVRQATISTFLSILMRFWSKTGN